MQTESSPAKSGADSEGNGVKVWHNGRLLDASEVVISPFDHGILVGDGVFETLISYGGKPFAETRHYRRLVRSADPLGLSVPAQEVIGDAMRAVLEANGLTNINARIRVTITGGLSPLGSLRGHGDHTVLVAASDVPPFGETGKVVTVDYPRNEKGVLSGHKTTSYGENVVALAYAKKQGAVEAIFGNTQGHLCEGTGTNIFIVVDGQLITPPISSGCLPGVTRSVVIDVCENEGIDLKEIDTPLSELPNVEEAFLTSTLREVQGIAQVNDEMIEGAPGPITQRLAKAFREFVKTTPDPE